MDLYVLAELNWITAPYQHVCLGIIIIVSFLPSFLRHQSSLPHINTNTNTINISTYIFPFLSISLSPSPPFHVFILCLYLPENLLLHFSPVALLHASIYCAVFVSMMVWRHHRWYETKLTVAHCMVFSSRWTLNRTGCAINKTFLIKRNQIVEINHI